MNRRIICFGRQLKEIIDAKEISASSLSKMMGFSSRTTVFRVLRDETSYDKLTEFLDILKRTATDVISGEEFTLLEDALEVSRVGIHNALCNRAICELLTPKEAEKTEIRVETFIRTGEKAVQGLAELMDCWISGGFVRIQMTGCCERAIFSLIRSRLFCQGQDASVVHYINSVGMAFIQGMVAVQPVLYCKHYDVLHIGGEDVSAQTQGLYCGNMMLVRWRDAHGEEHRERLTMTAPDCMSRFLYTTAAPFDYQVELLDSGRAYMSEIKTSCPPSSTPEDYVRYTAYCAQLEHRCEIYAMKPDIPVSYIHPDILWSALRRHFRESGQDVPETMDEGIAQLYSVHLARWENFFKKNKVTHTVLSYPAMRRFAETGALSDQFFAMCPHTREERRAILQHLRSQTVNNPYFTLYFMKKDFKAQKNEISLYEGHGVLFNKGDTDYRFEGNHAEALVIHPEFCNQFKTYYLGELLVNAVESRERTLELLDDLIARVS